MYPLAWWKTHGCWHAPRSRPQAERQKLQQHIPAWAWLALVPVGMKLCRKALAKNIYIYISHCDILYCSCEALAEQW